MSPAAARRTLVSGSAPSRAARAARRPAPARRGPAWRALGVVVQRGGGVAHERGEPDAVDLGRVDAEPVAVASRTIASGAERGSRARDQHLQALRRVDRRLVAPDQVDQPLGAHGRPPAAASAASSACERSPRRGLPASARPRAGSRRRSPRKSGARRWNEGLLDREPGRSCVGSAPDGDDLEVLGRDGDRVPRGGAARSTTATRSRSSAAAPSSPTARTPYGRAVALRNVSTIAAASGKRQVKVRGASGSSSTASPSSSATPSSVPHRNGDATAGGARARDGAEELAEETLRRPRRQADRPPGRHTRNDLGGGARLIGREHHAEADSTTSNPVGVGQRLGVGGLEHRSQPLGRAARGRARAVPARSRWTSRRRSGAPRRSSRCRCRRPRRARASRPAVDAVDEPLGDDLDQRGDHAEIAARPHRLLAALTAARSRVSGRGRRHRSFEGGEMWGRGKIALK